MRKVLLALMLMFSLSSFGETIFFKTTGFAMKQKYSNGVWSNWTDWQDSDMYITMNLETDVVKVFSPETQVYRITEHVRNYTDDSGGKQAEYRFIDQDGDRGSMRLRIEKNGNNQIYIEFADVMWVYNVRRISE